MLFWIMLVLDNNVAEDARKGGIGDKVCLRTASEGLAYHIALSPTFAA